MDVEDFVRYWKAMGGKKNEWRLALQEDLESLDSNNTSTHAFLCRARIPSQVSWY